MKNRNLKTAFFNDRTEAENAYKSAIDLGYTQDDINILMSDDTRKKYYQSFLVKKEKGDKSMEGLAIGGALGGTIAGTLGAVAAIGTVVAFPGLGLIVAGPLVAGLIGAGAGSISGGLIGALIGAGIPEDHAKFYEKGLKSGGILFIVNEREDLANLDNVWKKDYKETTY